MRKIVGTPTAEINNFIGTTPVDVADAYPASSYRKLVEQVAKLAYFNKDHLLFFRGQGQDYRNKAGASTLYPTVYRGDYLERREVNHRFDLLSEASRQLKELFASEGISGYQELARKPYIQWSILQHYTVCATPLLDLTHSVLVACSFAQLSATGASAFVYVLGLPYVTNRISVNSEHDLVNVRLLSICPPDAIRPYFQDGYLAGTEDITTEYFSKDELDFNNRLIAKFKIPIKRSFWGRGFLGMPDGVLYPRGDRVGKLCDAIKVELKDELLPGEFGEFMKGWTDLEAEIMQSAQQRRPEVHSFRDAVNVLARAEVVSPSRVVSLHELRNFRNLVVHQPKRVNPNDLRERIDQANAFKLELSK